MTVIIKIKSVYGQDKVYPLCATGKAFARIAGTKTLTEQTIHEMKTIGVKFVQEINPAFLG